MFSHEFNVKLRHTDAAGVVFFASYFTIAHDVYELALDSVGESLSTWLSTVPMPLVKSEALYKGPLKHGERARVDLGVERMGRSSFELKYVFWVLPQSARWASEQASDVQHKTDTWLQACELKTVHVAIDPKRGESIDLPPKMMKALDRLGPLHAQES